ncbi:MAG: metallophosphoesterase family protein [candidate division Zixibacteria bacterium]|nr:metallophosphoesterase family protein [candidate division Zixibacteria bacterium]
MKIAFISDIHGNLEALENVLRDIEKEGVEKIHFLGDVVGYGCNPNECVKLVDTHCEVKLLGNHDYATMGLESTDSFNQLAQTSISWTIGEITKKSVAILADFEIQSDFLDFHLVHASPGESDRWHYILNPTQALPQFDNFTQSVCFIGHSHIPTIFSRNGDGNVTASNKASLEWSPDKKYIINIGSVGQPRDNDSRACYLIADTELRRISYRRVEYNIRKTQIKMKKADLPNFLIERLATGL